MRGEAMQFLLYLWRQGRQCLLVAVAPGNQQLRDIGFGLAHHCFILQGLSPIVQSYSSLPERDYISQVAHALRAGLRRTGEEHSEQQMRPQIICLEVKGPASPVLGFGQIP